MGLQYNDIREIQLCNFQFRGPDWIEPACQRNGKNVSSSHLEHYRHTVTLPVGFHSVHSPEWQCRVKHLMDQDALSISLFNSYVFRNRRPRDKATEFLCIFRVQRHWLYPLPDPWNDIAEIWVWIIPAQSTLFERTIPGFQDHVTGMEYLAHMHRVDDHSLFSG
jgi:hypothetical protein